MEDENGETPLTTALKKLSYQKAKSLIEAGASIYTRNIRDESALQLIGSCSNLRLIKFILKKVKEDCSNNSMKIAEKLIEANWSLCRILLLQDVDVTEIALVSGYSSQLLTRNHSDGCTGLHVAVNNLDVDNVRLLLKYGSVVNTKNRAKKTPLSCLLENFNQPKFKRKLQILKMLLKQTNEPFKYLQTFNTVVRYGNKEAIKVFLKLGINSSVTDCLGNTTIHYFARIKFPGVFEQLRDKSFDVNALNKSKQTALMLATYINNVSAVEFLLGEGADIELFDENRRTALFYAINTNAVYRTFSFSGMDIERTSSSDEERRQCICALLERGANAFHERLDGQRTIFDSILNGKNSWAVDILMAHLALEKLKGTPITELIRSRVDSNDQFKDYFERSKQQLSVKIYESLTLFDFLTLTDKKFEHYARNKELMSNFQEHIRELGHSYYFHNVLKKRSTKAIQTATLKCEAGQIICRIMKMNYEIFPLIADQIVNYLDQRNMKNLIDAGV